MQFTRLTPTLSIDLDFLLTQKIEMFYSMSIEALVAGIAQIYPRRRAWSLLGP